MAVAIILAAGRGGRLGQLTEDRPKCLLEVGDASLLGHQLDALRQHGISRVVVVVGYRAEGVEAEVAGRATCLRNVRHAETNSFYSLWLAREFAHDGFLLLNADVLFDPEILRRVIALPYPDALAVERRSRFEAEEMKVELEGERIRALSKNLPPERAQAENVGVLKFSREGARVLFDKMEELLAGGQGEREFCPYAFDAIAPAHPLYAVPIEGLPWIEVDFVEDLRRAREEVWPAIRARRGAREAAEVSSVLPAENPSAVVGN
ncbi:MAG: phosphocholine cytidylyltransferase family protein [Acidobacteria bacterium]|nr:phosphocholine cytidylyltransferase family protein [Acidobacteriota bacterium]